MSRITQALLVVTALAAPAAGQSWEFEPIDSLQSNQYGARITLRKLPDGRLGACYGVGGQGIVRFAVRDSAWQLEDVATTGLSTTCPSFDVGQGGTVVVCHDDTGSSMCLATRTDTGWVRSNVPYPGRRPVIALDGDDDPYVICCPQVHAVAVSRRDSTWAIDTAVAGYAMGFYEISYGPAQFGSSGQATVFAGFFYDYSLHVYGGGLYLKQWSGDSWRVLWSIPSVHGLARALSVALDSAERPVTCYWMDDASGDSLHCAGDAIDGAACSATLHLDSLDRPHVAYVAGWDEGSLKYAWRSQSGWHVTTVPETHSVRACDFLPGPDGQPLIAYCRTDGGIWLARGVDVVGVEDGRLTPSAARVRPEATIVRGILSLQLAANGSRQELIDATGRKVLDLKAGDNDVSRLAPGIYFVVRKGSRGQGFEGSSEKVVITR